MDTETTKEVRSKSIVCYRCSKEGHIARLCQEQGNEKGHCRQQQYPVTGTGRDNFYSEDLSQLEEGVGLIDSGCTRTILGPSFMNRTRMGKRSVIAFDGSVVHCEGTSIANIEMNGALTKVECLVSSKMIEGVDVIVGMDVLKHHMITLDRGQVKLNNPPFVCCVKEPPLLKMKGRNFEGVFDGNKWVVQWSWKREPTLQKKISEYRMRENVKQKFDTEV
ncbi:Hypothetical protein FKW44_024087 [Caligus rogercresseyi]|uniref:CCHC-type domain-containing protein n=1 Tax=Caligus rogercresseyi TaxID=217165 RepID=A0A7T8JTX7_CALRO|nr:Hypothetical protein FKW44_024655 [Caligus rogercresseyi]QQP32903.1 Hypothetical protein FKW44_024087 [Caligus rogercresseyi]